MHVEQGHSGRVPRSDYKLTRISRWARCSRIQFSKTQTLPPSRRRIGESLLFYYCYFYFIFFFLVYALHYYAHIFILYTRISGVTFFCMIYYRDASDTFAAAGSVQRVGPRFDRFSLSSREHTCGLTRARNPRANTITTYTTGRGYYRDCERDRKKKKKIQRLSDSVRVLTSDLRKFRNSDDSERWRQPRSLVRHNHYTGTDRNISSSSLEHTVKIPVYIVHKPLSEVIYRNRRTSP